MAIEQLTPDHPLWAQLVAHLCQHNMAHEVLKTPDQPLPALYILGAVRRDEVIGHIASRMQRMVVPLCVLESTSQPLSDPNRGPLRELFVQSFAVNGEYRRRGFGRMLQVAALDLAQRLGCYQLRSWCALENTANYALQLSLGFAAHPAMVPAANGRSDSGVYFIKVVRGAAWHTSD